MKKRIVTLLLLQMALPFALSGCNTDNNAPEATSTPAVKGLWTPSASINKIVVLSDIHLGVDDRYSETVENRDLLLDFLVKLENTSDVREVVLNGDFLDDWYLPLTYATYSGSREILPRGHQKQSGSDRCIEQPDEKGHQTGLYPWQSRYAAEKRSVG